MNCIARWLSAFWAIIWRSCLFMVLWGILLTPAVIPFAARLKAGQRVSPPQMLYFDAASALTILAAAWLMVRLVDRRPFVSLGFAPRHLIRELFLGVILGAGWLVLSIAILWLAGWITPQSSLRISWVNLVWTAGALVFNTLCQELLTRSYIFQTIQSRTSAPVAILSSSVLFSALHVGAFQGAWLLPAVNLFVAGVLFGTAYCLSGNLWLPIAIHFTWNLLLGPVLGLTVSGRDELNGGWQVFSVHGPTVFTGGAFGIEGGLLVTLTSVACIGVIFLLFRRNNTMG